MVSWRLLLDGEAHGFWNMGVDEALVATAAGLLAAIPAVIFYNHFLGRLRSMDARVEEFIADLVHRIQGRRR